MTLEEAREFLSAQNTDEAVAALRLALAQPRDECDEALRQTARFMVDHGLSPDSAAALLNALLELAREPLTLH